MSRTYVVTGAASDAPPSSCWRNAASGWSESICVTRTSRRIYRTPAARAALAAQVEEASGGVVDAVIAVGGVAMPTALTPRVNYFGAVATLEQLRSLLTRSQSPRAVVVASFSASQENDADLVAAMLSGDEEAAATRADELNAAGRGDLVYPSSKRAIAEWVRAQSVTAEWAGAGIPLNAVGPGIILTPMAAPLLETEEGRAALDAIVPMPLQGPAEPIVIARALAWLTGEENTHTTGQVLFVDGGADVSIRGPRVFGASSR